jgi:ribosomal protein S27AE
MEYKVKISHVELKVQICGRSCESTLFLASHDVEVIRPELFCIKSRKSIVFYIWGGGGGYLVYIAMEYCDYLCIVAYHLKAGISESERASIARQRLGSRVPASLSG